MSSSDDSFEGVSDKKYHPFLSNPTNNKFKDSRNQWITRGIFYEFRGDSMEPLYTLKEDDFKGCKSLKKIYMSYEHIPGYEYEFAENELGGWEHWQRLQASEVLNVHFKQWREELDVKLRAKAIKNIILTAYGKDKNSLQAARYLADKGYIPPEQKRGRPSKEEKARALREESLVREEVDEDMKRLGIIQGGKK